MSKLKKYELTSETFNDLFRIRALQDIPNWGVKKGDLGGFVQSENNLSQSDSAWVFGNVQVYGDARVYGNARVFGNAQVSDNARVYGNAQVFDNARMFDDAWVFGNVQVYGDARVYGNARVYGDARVFDNAQVYGNVQVFGNAQVYGNVQVFGNAWVSGNARVSKGLFKHGHTSKNPDKRHEIYVSTNSLPDPSGHYIFYKNVWKTEDPEVFVSDYDPTFSYKIGLDAATLSDPAFVQCSEGLHVATADFTFAGDTKLACRVHIDDILYWGDTKLRCSHLTPLYAIPIPEKE